MQLPKPKYIDEYTIRYDSMDEFYAQACQKITQWETALKKWENACNNLISMQSFQGQAAMAAKTYLQETNNLLLPAIKQTFAAYKTQFLLYKTGYYAIDSHTYSVIPEEVLRGIMGKLGAEIWDTELLSDDVNAIIDSISDICPLTKPSMDSLQTDLDTLRSDIRTYKDKIDQYEYTKYNQLNTELQPLIDALQNTIKSFLETGENLATYQAGTAASNTELQNLTEQVNIAEQYLQDNQTQIQQAVEQQTAIYAQIEKDQDMILEAQCEGRKDQGSAQMLQSTIGATVTVAIMVGAAIVAPVSIFVTTCVVGGGAFLYNASNFYEGAENYYYGSIKDLESIAINPLEDTVFGDDEETYDAFGNFNMTAVGLCGAAMTSMGPGAITMELMQNTYSGAVTSYLTTGIANTCNLNQTQSILLGTVLDYAVDQNFDGNRVRYMSDGIDLNGHVYTPNEAVVDTTNIHISDADMPLGVYNGDVGGSGSKFQDVFDLADNYNLSDDTFNNHILDRHGPNSAYGNKSHFNTDFDIREGIDSTLKGENFVVGPNTAGREGYIFEQTFTNPIGTSSKGKPLYTLKVVIDEAGNVLTAFPKK